MRRLLIGEARVFPALAREYFDRAPGQVIDALASGFEHLEADGLLRVPEPRRAAAQFAYLVAGEPLDRAILAGTIPSEEDHLRGGPSHVLAEEAGEDGVDGMVVERAEALNPMRPPGLATLRISPRAAPRSGRNCTASWQRTMSTEPTRSSGAPTRARCPVASVVLDAPGAGTPLAELCREAVDTWERIYATHLIRAGLTAKRARALATMIVATVEGAILLARARRDTGALTVAKWELSETIEQALEGS